MHGPALARNVLAWKTSWSKFMASHTNGLVSALLFTALGCSTDAGERSAPGPGSGGSSAIGSGGRTHGSAGDTIVVPMAGSSNGGGDCSSTLQVTYRDFRETHPDFEMPFRGDVVRRGLVEPALGPDQKPIFKDRVGCPADVMTPLGCDDDWSVEQPVIASAESFGQWYRNVADVNLESLGTLTLEETGPGSGEYVFESSAFFPLAPTDGFGITPVGHYMGKNFLFTTEIHVSFGYRLGQKFAFRGDDDLWIFVNGKLAMDLGSMHGPQEGVIDFDAQSTQLGIQPGGTYRMDVFHAERHTDGSNFKFTTNISCFTPVVVR
jgi:fibro-slime domain-containing protein